MNASDTQQRTTEYASAPATDWVEQLEQTDQQQSQAGQHATPHHGNVLMRVPACSHFDRLHTNNDVHSKGAIFDVKDVIDPGVYTDGSSGASVVLCSWRW